VGDGPEPIEPVVFLKPRPEAHLLKLVDGPGREAVATSLVAGELLALDDHCV